MKSVFLDTNILVDLLANRRPFGRYATLIFTWAEGGGGKLYTSSHAIATTYYLMKKYAEDSYLREILIELIDFVAVIPVDVQVLRSALVSDIRDVEDGIQIICAQERMQVDCVITRNKRDFKKAAIPVYSPDEFCIMMGFSL